MFRLGYYINANLPFILSQLLPYISLADLQEARHQFNHTRRDIAARDLIRNDYDPAILERLSNILDQAITRQQSSPA